MPPTSDRVVIVDDDRFTLSALTRDLGELFEVQTFERPQEALAHLSEHAADVVLSDLHMPAMSGLELMSELRSRSPELPVVMMTGDSTLALAIDAMKSGAFDYLLKPFSSEQAELALRRAIRHKRLSDDNRELRRRLDVADRFAGIVGQSPRMRELFRSMDTVAGTTATVLLLGESGTGKELIARALHERSRRRAKPFVAINCSALTDTLLQSELFGHVRGAFSGAEESRQGVFEVADGGTLLLDEIGDISPQTQLSLLRVLQEQEIRPVGSTSVKRVDVRVIAATNRMLLDDVRLGRFREDLYYRLRVVALEVPPLRERPTDLPLLSHHFLRKHAERHRRAVTGISSDAMDVLSQHHWPGNVRELENVIQSAVIMSATPEITIQCLPSELRGRSPRRTPPAEPAEPLLPFAEAKSRAIECFEVKYLEDMLSRAAGSVARAARLAGMDRSNLRRLLRRNGIEPERFRRDDQGQWAEPDSAHADRSREVGL